jgi:hypothetical protein
MLKLSKLLAVGLGTFFAVIALLIVRFVMLARNSQAGTRATAVDVYLLVHSTWLILSFIAVLALAGWISYRWIFKS